MSENTKVYQIVILGTFFVPVLLNELAHSVLLGNNCMVSIKLWHLHDEWHYRGICSFFVEA